MSISVLAVLVSRNNAPSHACLRPGEDFTERNPSPASPQSSTLMSLKNLKFVSVPLLAATFVFLNTAASAVEASAAKVTGDQLVWQTDYAAALKQAKTENRKVFLFFTGSDWCSWCKRLNQEILSTPDFARYAKEKLILVEVDFPKKRPQSATLQTQNAKLARTYHIEGYPTVVILDSSGKKIDELGYQEGGPSPFLARLSKL